MAKKRMDISSLDAENADVLVEMVIDPFTSDHLRVQILNKLLEGAEADNFFDTIFKENLDLGECPECGHENHWLIPEDELNKRGFVTNEKDKRVPRMTTPAECKRWEQACKKKKVIV